MNSYEAKQAARRERMAERAENLREQAAREYRKADLREEASGIPLGQPILVGHHSERKHRRTIERADNAMRRSIEATRKAEELERRAANPSAAISSDDPDACQKLRAKIERAERAQVAMKAANKVIRAAVKRGVTDATECPAWTEYLSQMQEVFPGISGETAAKHLQPDFAGRIGFPSFELTNNNANIRRMQQRLQQLEKAAQAETVEVEPVEGLRVVENVEANRVQLFFDGKPDDETRARLKQGGFRWARSQSAWQRHLNNAGRYAAESFGKWYAERG